MASLLFRLRIISMAISLFPALHRLHLPDGKLLSPLAKEVASRLGLGEEELELPAIESALVRLNLEFCKGRKCSSCPVKEGCHGAGAA